MMTLSIEGEHAPSRTKEPDKHKLWKRTDPIWILRQCLGNKLRSKHWRTAHHAKKRWVDAVGAEGTYIGEPVCPPVLLIVRHGLPHCPDVDAPVKVILDAIQDKMITTHDDKDIALMIVMREEIGKKKRKPFVHVEAVSFSSEPFEAQSKASQALADAQRKADGIPINGNEEST